ncbi:hypothetical protein BHE74_00058397 [Ensete ventricosum]|nr:hypothetical protein BHE74_00058397 [Ensete ventricosum]
MGCRRWAAARGQAIEVVAYGQKLPPARVATRTNARRGGAYRGAAHGRGAGHKSSSARTLAERLPAGKAVVAYIGALAATTQRGQRGDSRTHDAIAGDHDGW